MSTISDSAPTCLFVFSSNSAAGNSSARVAPALAVPATGDATAACGAVVIMAKSCGSLCSLVASTLCKTAAALLIDRRAPTMRGASRYISCSLASLSKPVAIIFACGKPRAIASARPKSPSPTNSITRRRGVPVLELMSSFSVQCAVQLFQKNLVSIVLVEQRCREGKEKEEMEVAIARRHRALIQRTEDPPGLLCKALSHVNTCGKSR